MGLPRYWVNTAALSLVAEDTDFSYSGPGPKMAMTRTYNSNNLKWGMFGRGWTFSYERSVNAVFCSDSPVTLKTGEGSFIQFDKTPQAGCSYTGNNQPISLTPSYPSRNRDALTLFTQSDYSSSYWIHAPKGEFTNYRYDLIPTSPGWCLTTITDSAGKTVTISYNKETGTIDTITDSVGRVTSFAYQNASYGNLCTSMTLPNGLKTSYYYDATGNLIKTVDLMGNESLYTYDAGGYMLSMSVGGKTTAFTYDPTVYPNQLHTLTDAAGKTQTFAAGTSALGNTVTDSSGNVSYFASTSEGLSTSTQDPMNFQSTMTYTGGLPSSYTSPTGWSTQMTYDTRGNLTSTAASGSYPFSVTYTYDANDNPISITNPQNETWLYQYDAQHNLTEVTRPTGNATGFGYTNGLLTSITDANGKTTTFDRDSYGNVSKVTDPVGNVELITYDAQGILRLSETDPAGNKTSYTYDKNNRLTSITYADKSTMTLTHDCCSLTGITDENGNTTEIARDNLYHAVSISDPLGNSTQLHYDNANSLTAITRPTGAVRSFTNDKLYRPSVITDELGNTTSLAYDGLSNLSSLTDERGNKTAFYYDGTRPISVIDPLGNHITTSWDPSARLMAWINSRWGGVSFSYTPDGQLSEKRTYYPDGPIASYTYDAVGNLTEVSDPAGNTGYAYDDARRLIAIIYPDLKSVSFSYAPTGKIAVVEYPGGVAAAYTYDDRNRVASVAWGANTVDISHDPAGNVISETRSNGTDTLTSYDQRNLVTAVNHKKGSSSFAQMSYGRDKAGNIVQESTTLPLSPLFSKGTVNAAYNAVNQLVTRGADTYTYDADGNLTGISGSKALTAIYDQENRLTAITLNGVTTNYTYNGLGLRTMAVTGTQVINSYYDASGRLLFQSDAGGQITAYYFYSGRRPIAMGTPSGGYYYYHYDSTGNTIALTDGSGAVVSAYTYAPFGKITNQTGSIANPFTYKGAYGVMDDGDGLYFMTHRYYDASTGKFMQKDPVGIVAGTANLYMYVHDNPINFKDPKGTWDGDTPDGDQTSTSTINLDYRKDPVSESASKYRNLAARSALQFTPFVGNVVNAYAVYQSLSNPNGCDQMDYLKQVFYCTPVIGNIANVAEDAYDTYYATSSAPIVDSPNPLPSVTTALANDNPVNSVDDLVGRMNDPGSYGMGF